MTTLSTLPIRGANVTPPWAATPLVTAAPAPSAVTKSALAAASPKTCAVHSAVCIIRLLVTSASPTFSADSVAAAVVLPIRVLAAEENASVTAL